MVVVRRLRDIPGRQRQGVHVLQAVQPQHVHVGAAAVVPRDEAALAPPQKVYDDVSGAHLIIHAEEHRHTLRRHVPGVGE